MRPGGDVCILAVGKMVEAAEEAASCSTRVACTRRCGTFASSRSTAECWPTRGSYDLVVTAEDGIAEGGVGTAIVSALARMDSGKPVPPTITLGTPLAYLPHGKPADLLANLGLDGPGIAATVLKALDAED